MIMNAGWKGDNNYVATVENAYIRYKSFLQSPAGGYWREDEILGVDRFNGGVCLKTDFGFKFTELNKPDVDYSLIVFIGHGAAINGTDSFQLEDKKTVVSINFLKTAIGYSTPMKRIIIVDACRSYVATADASLVLEQRAFSRGYQLNGQWCKEYYNSLIEKTVPHIEIIQSTQYNTCAHGSATGTAFTDALFDTIMQHNMEWNNRALMDRLGEYSSSFPDVLDEVKQRMAIWSQVPEFTNDSDTLFPLFAIKRPTTRVIQGGEVLGIVTN